MRDQAKHSNASSIILKHGEEAILEHGSVFKDKIENVWVFLNFLGQLQFCFCSNRFYRFVTDVRIPTFSKRVAFIFSLPKIMVAGGHQLFQIVLSDLFEIEKP